MKTILLTGASGIVGNAIRPVLRECFDQVLLTDLRELSADLALNESFEQGDIADLRFMKNLAGQVDGIVHLAGLVGAAFTFEEVLRPNILGTQSVFEAAVHCGIRNTIFASSHHVVGFLRRGQPIDHRTPPRPNSQYALSKAYGEASASFHADKYGLNVLVIRIGYVGDDLSKERRLRTWISPRDLVQLIEIGLKKPDLGCEIVYGVSDNPDSFFDNANATRLGYQPQDRSPDFAADPSLIDVEPELETLEGGLIGGGFAAEGFAGNLKRILGR